MNRSAWDIGKPDTTTYKINDMYKARPAATSTIRVAAICRASSLSLNHRPRRFD